LWFSARDIDLLPTGAKIVTPHVLNVQDVADEFVSLVNSDAKIDKKSDRLALLANNLSKSLLGPILYVLDNFETVTNPAEFYQWIDTYIRPPNKILITTRHREFKGDFPVDVKGMTPNESTQLIDATAKRLGIQSLLTAEYRDELFHESEGHPYVMKILLGEVAKAKKITKVSRIVAGADEILSALFERTYSRLSPAAQRVFLTVCNWRATVPVVALEAVMLRSADEKLDVGDAVSELRNFSFVEVTSSSADQQDFVTVPLITAEFGKRKLSVSPLKAAIEADTQLLHEFGGGPRTDLHRGVEPRIGRLLRFIARRVSEGKAEFSEYVPMLELIGRRYRRAWLQLAELYEELGGPDRNQRQQEAIRRFLEGATGPEALEGWRRLANLCRVGKDQLGEVQALIEVSQRTSNLEDLSQIANRVNFILAEKELVLDADQKRNAVSRLANAMSSRITNADATDLSRLAWLYLHLGDTARAERVAAKGLAMDPENEHCLRLLELLHR